MKFDLFLVHNTFQDFGGAERKIISLHNYATENSKKSIIYSFSKPPSNLGLIMDSIKKDSFIFGLRGLMCLLFCKVEHLIISNHPVQLYLILLAPILRLKSSRITWLVNEIPYKLRSSSRVLIYSYLSRLFIFLTKARLVSNSKNTCKDIRRYLKINSEIVYPGIVEKNYRCDIYQRGSRCLVLGRISSDKNFELLFELLKQYPELEIDICGSMTSTSDKVESLLSPFKSRVSYRYDISFKEKIRYLHQAKCAFFLPKHEPFGVVPLEFIASGLPFVCFRSTGFARALAKIEEISPLCIIVDSGVEFIESVPVLTDSKIKGIDQLPTSFTHDYMCAKILNV